MKKTITLAPNQSIDDVVDSLVSISIETDINDTDDIKKTLMSIIQEDLNLKLVLKVVDEKFPQYKDLLNKLLVLK